MPARKQTPVDGNPSQLHFDLNCTRDDKLRSHCGKGANTKRSFRSRLRHPLSKMIQQARASLASPDPQEEELDTSIASIRAESKPATPLQRKDRTLTKHPSSKPQTPQTLPLIQPPLLNLHPNPPPQTTTSKQTNSNIPPQRPLTPRTSSRQALNHKSPPRRLRDNGIPVRGSVSDYEG